MFLRRQATGPAMAPTLLGVLANGSRRSRGCRRRCSGLVSEPDSWVGRLLGWPAPWLPTASTTSTRFSDLIFQLSPPDVLQEFKRRMHMMNPMNQIGGRGWDQNYYDNNYQRNECMFGCPANSHCEWGFCECNAGTSRFFKAVHLLKFSPIVFQEVRSVPVRLESGSQLFPSTSSL